MNRYQHSKSSLFLMEIMLNIFFFVILSVFCLQLFQKAGRLSADTTELYQAVSASASIAEVCQSDPDTISALLHVYPYATVLPQTILIYFDESFHACEEASGIYRASVSIEGNSLQTATVLFHRIHDTEEIYTLTFSSYKELTPASPSRGVTYE